MQGGRRRLVGVVDDDAAVRDSLRLLLASAGIEAVEFASAEQYLAVTAPDRFGCLLVDQHMPVIAGLDLLQRLRDTGRELPVALMTGSPSVPLRRRALELGAVTVLEKPLTEQALFAFIEKAIG